jgi:hypothetical protein
MSRAIWVEGTSIESGYGLSEPFPWVQCCLYPGGYSVVNKAVASSTIADCDANTSGSTNSITHRVTAAGGLVDTLGPTLGANAIIVIGSGNTNGAYFGVSAADDWANMVALAAIIVDECPLAKLVMTESIPRDNWSSSPFWAGSATPFNAALADYTTLARAGWMAAGFTRAPVNLNASGRFNSTAGALFQDACHPSVSGHALLGAEWFLSRAWE